MLNKGDIVKIQLPFIFQNDDICLNYNYCTYNKESNCNRYVKANFSKRYKETLQKKFEFVEMKDNKYVYKDSLGKTEFIFNDVYKVKNSNKLKKFFN